MDAPVAIVTGASRGIGRATALHLASKGYRLLLTARGKPDLDSLAAQIRHSRPIPADVTSPDDVQLLVDEAIASFGRIDVLVNNAGLAPVATVEELSLADWHKVIETNLSSAFYLSKACWPIFRKQQRGCIVNISSFSSRDPLPGFVAYGAAKAGVNMLTLALAREGAPLGIRVYAIAPGAVETSMFRAIATEEQWPKEKTLQPSDIARAIAACVDGDLKYASGEVIFLSRAL
jgi:NAD(P)-dependent dehydrogenase (short-subunit alcohol dehydrogenase family)